MSQTAIQTKPDDFTPALEGDVTPQRGREPGTLGPWARRILGPIASLRLTVVLFALAMILVFCGTIAQKRMGLWTAVDQYFRTGLVWIPFQIFVEFGQVFLNVDPSVRVGGSFPFPGGWLLGGLLLVNLLAAHALRFRFSLKDLILLPMFALGFWLLWVWQEDPSGWLLLWAGSAAFLVSSAGLLVLHGRRGGVILIHLGLVIMMLSELFTGLFAVEARMTIPEGETVDFVDVSRDVELALTEPYADDHDDVVVVPGSALKKGGVIRDDLLPVDIEVGKYHVNSLMVPSHDLSPDERRTALGNATSVTGHFYKVVPRPEESGGSDRSDYPAVRLRFKEKGTGKALGDYLVSLWFYRNATTRDPEHRILPRLLKVGDKSYRVELRPRRIYKPYSLHLIKFTHKKYIGTTTPKDFASQALLTDPGKQEKREVRISMNAPLRHRGETLYQAGWLGQDQGTVLQVVRNPSWLLPYIACGVVSIGMLVHFGLHLVAFLRRRAA